ncbi:MAG: branched-chain amino acid ABC transporter substrate-binding protein, partial [Cupriavidus sp.]|nr:branched-chain amino acid ABC transporter substrate-binding protein [Cupriavidus sp.]
MSDPFQSAGRYPGRLGGRLALTALAAAAGLAVAAAALAQVPAAPGEPYLDAPVADAAQQQVDPSSRIATLTAVDGSLGFAPAGSDAWAAAGLNRPVTTGDRLWLEPGGRAELHAGTVALRMGGATAASILNLDDST